MNKSKVTHGTLTVSHIGSDENHSGWEQDFVIEICRF